MKHLTVRICFAMLLTIGVSTAPSEESRTGYIIKYLPFGTSTFLPVTVANYQHLYDMTSVWDSGANSLVDLLRTASEPATFRSSFVRMLIYKRGKLWLAVDSNGTVMSEGKGKALSKSEFEKVKVWIFLNTPRPDLPLGLGSAQSAQ